MAADDDIVREQRWWEKEDDEFATRVAGIGNSLDRDAAMRKERYRRNIVLYENRNFSSLDEAVYFRDLSSFADERDIQPLRFNLIRSAVDTVHAEICGRQKPKPQFATTDADWLTMRRTKRLDRAEEAVLRQKHGKYATSWALAEDVLLDAVTFGTGIIKVVEDIDESRVLLERAKPWEVLIDPAEADRGAIYTAIHKFPMDLAAALVKFGDTPELEDAIIAGPRVKREEGQIWVRDNEAVEITEVWRRPAGKKAKGAHAFLCGSRVLYREDWEHDIPLVFLHWAQPRIGFWGMSLVEEGERMQYALDEDLQKLDERVRVCSGMLTFVAQNSVDKKDLEGNEAGKLVEYVGQVPPQTVIPDPIAPSEFEYQQYLKQSFFETLGVSQMRAASRKDPGVTAGVAIRAINDIQTVRFANKAKAYENMFVELGTKIAHALKRLSESADDFKITWRDKNRLIQYAWSDIDIEPDQLVVTVAPASALPQDQGERLQFIQELAQAGWLSDPEEIMELLGWPDFERKLSAVTAERDFVEKVLEGILDAEEGDEALFPDPDPLVSNKAAMLKAAQTQYMQAQVMDAPEYILDALREFIRKVDAQIAAAQPPPAPAMPPPGAPPMMPPDMGAPQMPPPMMPGPPMAA